MRQYIGLLLTAVAVLMLVALRDLPFVALGVSIYVAGAVMILTAQRRPAQRVEEPRRESRRPTPDELKKRPIQPPEI